MLEEQRQVSFKEVLLTKMRVRVPIVVGAGKPSVFFNLLLTGNLGVGRFCFGGISVSSARHVGSHLALNV